MLCDEAPQQYEETRQQAVKQLQTQSSYCRAKKARKARKVLPGSVLDSSPGKSDWAGNVATREVPIFGFFWPLPRIALEQAVLNLKISFKTDS